MAINVSFNGATIFKPGAYSKTTIDLGGGFPIGPAGLVGIFGEAEAGAPASSGDIRNNVFSPEQLPEIRAKYGSGPIVDAAAFAFAPAADAAIPSGAQALYIYKTNASTRSVRALGSSYADLISIEYGEGANRMTMTVAGLDELAPVAGPGAAFDEGAGSFGGNSETFSLELNGAAENVFTFSGAVVDNAGLAAQLANAGNWSAGLPVGMTITVAGADAASTVEIAMDADLTQYQKGSGRSFKLVDGVATPLVTMGLGAIVYLPAVEASRDLTVSQKRDLIDEESTIGGNVALSVGFDSAADDATAAAVSVDADELSLLVTGGAEAGTMSWKKSDYVTLTEMAAAMNLSTGVSASVDALATQLSPAVLDQVTAVGALSESGDLPARLKKDAAEFEDFFTLSQYANIDGDAPVVGLPDVEGEAYFAGAVKGASSTASIQDAMDAFTKIRLNSVVPLFSRDATDDFADGLTDVGSTYTIAGVHQAVKTHLSLTATTKKRSERQGYLSFKDDYVSCKERAQVLADARIQLMIQDARQLKADGTLAWFQPWALAVMMAGARGGSPIGTPLTNKNLNIAGLRHTGQSMSTAEEDIVLDFDPDVQVDDAIQNGITFLEAPVTGGFRIVVDNTTYGRDGNFVYNRGNVLHAADTVVYELRNQLEAIYVGLKNTITAVEVKSTVQSIMVQFLNQGITVQSDDAPNGYKNLVVRIEGNTIYIDLVAKLVEGIDFILVDLTVQRKTAAA